MRICKAIRYILSGYIFERKKILKSLEKENEFSPTNKVYNIGRVAIYTVSTGGYDSVKEPIYKDDNFDYFVFTNADVPENSVWKKISAKDLRPEMTPLEQARYIKTHPHNYFKEYEYSVFIDGNVQIATDIRPLIFTMIYNERVIAIHRHNIRNCAYHEGRIIWAQGRAKWCDIKKQLTHYRKEGFPKHFGLFETNIVIRKHQDPNCINIMETWWNEIDNFTKRDQLSFTYSLWKNNVDSNFVMSLGNCSRKSSYFVVSGHNK